LGLISLVLSEIFLEATYMLAKLEYCARCGSPEHLELTREVGPSMVEQLNPVSKQLERVPAEGLVDYDIRCWKCGFTGRHSNKPGLKVNSGETVQASLTMEDVETLVKSGKGLDQLKPKNLKESDVKFTKPGV
jgi:hypothetical protein